MASKPTLTIYSSLPQQGPERQQALAVIDAEQLALRQINNDIGRYKIKLISLDDASSTTGLFSSRQVLANAQRAANDPTAIAYIGELTPGSSGDSIKVLNKAGLLQVSPGDTAQAVTETPSLEPSGQTFARFAPPDSAEASAQLSVMRALRVRRLFVVADDSRYGRGIARSVVQRAASFGVTPVGDRSMNPTAYRALTKEIQASRADAMFFGGLTSTTAVELWDRVAMLNPHIKLFGPRGLDNDSFAAAIDPAAQRRTFLSEPGVSAGQLPPAGQTFLADFKAAYNQPPISSAFFGYAAAEAVLYAIHLAGPGGGDRALVAKKFFALKDVSSVLGTYSIGDDGNSTIVPYFTFSTVRNGHRVLDTLVMAPTPGASQTAEAFGGGAVGDVTPASDPSGVGP
jgi:branched-chain amino acid transport system substrate-binding protein